MMKYSNEVVINLPVKRVVELFDNPENLKKWQPGLVSFEHISGTPGHNGAKSKLVYKIGKRTIEMIETVTCRNLPREFCGTYEAKGVFNEVKNYFTPVGDNKTRYVSESTFKFSGIMKIFSVFMTGTFKKQSQKYLDMFKEFAEKEG